MTMRETDYDNWTGYGYWQLAINSDFRAMYDNWWVAIGPPSGNYDYYLLAMMGAMPRYYDWSYY